MFLWHEPVTRWLSVKGLTVDGVLGAPLDVVIVLLVVLPLAYATYRLVERPAMSLRTAPLRQRQSSRKDRQIA